MRQLLLVVAAALALFVRAALHADAPASAVSLQRATDTPAPSVAYPTLTPYPAGYPGPVTPLPTPTDVPPYPAPAEAAPAPVVRVFFPVMR